MRECNMQQLRNHWIVLTDVVVIKAGESNKLDPVVYREYFVLLTDHYLP